MFVFTFFTYVGGIIATFIAGLFLRSALHAGKPKEYFWDWTDKKPNGDAKLKYRIINEGEPTKVYKNGCKETPDNYKCYTAVN